MLALAIAVRWLRQQQQLLQQLGRRRLLSHLHAVEAPRVLTAAHALAVRGGAGFEAELLRTLQVWSQRRDTRAGAVCAAVLRVLVQTEAVVPAALLRPFLHGPHAVAAFVLLARTPQLNELELLALFRRLRRQAPDPCDLRWLAAGNLLCSLRTPGFAGILLRDTTWSLCVHVVDDDEPEGAGAAARAGAEHALAAGFPGRCLGRDLAAGEPGGDACRLVLGAGERLAPGRHAVGYEIGHGGSPRITASFADLVRSAWLGELAALPVAVASQCVVPNSALAVLPARVAHQRQAIEQLRRRLSTALVGAGALMPAEVLPSACPLRIDLRDRRRHAVRPLPDLPGMTRSLRTEAS